MYNDENAQTGAKFLDMQKDQFDVPAEALQLLGYGLFTGMKPV